MNKRVARVIRAGITDGRKFVMLATTTPGLTSDDLGHDLRGIYGKAYIHTVLHSHWRGGPSRWTQTDEASL